MKVYILKEEDFENLIVALSRNKRYGENGVSSSSLDTQQEQKIFDDAHRFYNYIIQRWLDKVKGEH